MKNTSRLQGFTLIELLVVIAIIGILSGIVITSLGGSRSKGRDAQRISDLHQIQLALTLYFDRCSQYPSSLAIGANNGCPSSPVINLGSFISQIPTPPSGTYDYSLPSSGTPNNYVLHVTIETPNAAVAKGLSAMPGGLTPSYTCSNATNSLNYCIGPN